MRKLLTARDALAMTIDRLINLRHRYYHAEGMAGKQQLLERPARQEKAVIAINRLAIPSSFKDIAVRYAVR